jgi:hypothetical protein
MANVRTNVKDQDILRHGKSGKQNVKFTAEPEHSTRQALNRAQTLKQAGKLDEPETGVNVDTLAEAYLRYMKNSKPKSYLWVKRAWDKQLEPFFGGRLAGRVGTSELDRYIEQRRQGIDDQDQERKRNATITRELTIMKAMFNHASRELDPPLVSNGVWRKKRLARRCSL